MSHPRHDSSAWLKQPHTPQARLVLTLVAGFLGIGALIYVSSPATSLHSYRKAVKSKYGDESLATPWEDERLAESEHFYTGMLEEREEFLGRLGGKDKLQSFPGGGNFYSLWDFFIPEPSFCQHRISRVGTLGDGGKWVCGIQTLIAPRQKCVIYSFGLNGESSFEADVLEKTKGCEIWGYDFSVKSFGPQIPPHHAARTHFFPYKLTSNQDPTATPPEWTLGGLMRKNGHKWVDLIKMDIEGSEFSVLTSFLEEFPNDLPFGQLQLEIHASADSDFKQFLGWWESLEKAGLRPFWVEPNLVYVNWFERKATLTEYAFLNIRRSA